MPIRPTREQLAVLDTTERISFRVAEFAADRLAAPAEWWNRLFMGGTIWACGGRRLHVHGLEHLAKFDRTSTVLLVANHRSFFDFFVISAVLFWKSPLSKRIFFPVRSTFFYDHPLGTLVNATMSGLRMYPPILREREKAAFNKWSLARCVEALDTPGTVMGIHPEGTRGKGPDPYELLPAQPGVGKVALEAKRAHVVPVFVLGMSNSLGREFAWNWGSPEQHPIHVSFGRAIDLSDLRAHGSRPAIAKRAADRCVAAIAELGRAQRATLEGAPKAETRRRTSTAIASDDAG
jgi:1-acyl-sn-glycerol-3-phosphate acyltransferase